MSPEDGGVWADADSEKDEDSKDRVEDKLVDFSCGFQEILELGPVWSCQEELPDDWINPANMIKERGRKVCTMACMEREKD